MSRRATRQPDLFAASPAASGADDALPTLPDVDPKHRAWVLDQLTRELEEVEAASEVPLRHDTSRAMGKEMSFKGRLWQLDPADAACLLARWEAAWARHWDQWEIEEQAKMAAAER